MLQFYQFMPKIFHDNEKYFGFSFIGKGYEYIFFFLGGGTCISSKIIFIKS